jgi:hypothetical protein
MRATFGGNREPSSGTIPLVQQILDTLEGIRSHSWYCRNNACNFWRQLRAFQWYHSPCATDFGIRAIHLCRSNTATAQTVSACPPHVCHFIVPCHASPILSNNPSQPLTSTLIPDSLPSSQLLLEFSPASIVSYSPYIDIASAKAQLSSNVISTATAAWFDASLASLRSDISAWFDCLDIICSVWQQKCAVLYKNHLAYYTMK